MKSYFTPKIELEHLVFLLLFASFFLFHNNLGNDFYWHLKTGEYIYLNQALPSSDPFSFTHNEVIWTLHEWLFELILYTVHTYFGLYGVQFLIASLLTLATFIVYRSAVLVNCNKYLCLLLSAITFTVIVNFGLPRPQLFTYVFLAIYIYILVGYKYQTYAVNIFLLPLLMILWVNLHAGYVIGLSLLVLFIVSEFIEQKHSSHHIDTPHAQLKPLIIATSLCIGSSLINPYTYHLWIYPFEVMSMSVINGIAEWKSPDFHHPINKLYLVYVFTYFFLRNYTRKQPALIENIIVLSLLIMSFKSNRHIPIALLALLPFFALTLKDFKSPIKSPDFITNALSGISNNIEKHTATQQFTNSNIITTFLFIIIATSTYVLHSITDKRLEYFEYYAFPVDAVEFIKDTHIEGNVLNMYGIGGYLIYSLYPNSKVFIDGRADLYGDKHFYVYKSIIDVMPGWKKHFDEYHFDYILCHNYAPITWPLSQMNEYTLIYRDVSYSIYLKNTDKNKPLFKKYRKSLISKSFTLLDESDK